VDKNEKVIPSRAAVKPDMARWKTNHLTSVWGSSCSVIFRGLKVDEAAIRACAHSETLTTGCRPTARQMKRLPNRAMMALLVGGRLRIGKSGAFFSRTTGKSALPAPIPQAESAAAFIRSSPQLEGFRCHGSPAESLPRGPGIFPRRRNRRNSCIGCGRISRSRRA